MEPDDIATYAEIFKAGGENHSSICMSIGKIQSKGSIFFHHANPLDYSVPLLLAQLSLASLFVLLTSTLLKPLGQPTNVIQIFVSSLFFFYYLTFSYSMIVWHPKLCVQNKLSTCASAL